MATPAASASAQPSAAVAPSAAKTVTPAPAPQRRAAVAKPHPSLRQQPAAAPAAAEAFEMEAESSEPGRRMQGDSAQEERVTPGVARRDIPRRESGDMQPTERQLRIANSFDGDVRSLPHVPSVSRERPEIEGPEPAPQRVESEITLPSEVASSVVPPTQSAPAPSPDLVFEGLDRESWGAGSPPDTTGDVGPDYYIQGVNTSVGIFRKSDGVREAAFTFNTLMSQGNSGTLCDTDNFGDPVILYDTFEDRWTLTDFAFKLDGSGNVLAPAYQCFAVSKTGNPLTGGWNFYSVQVPDALNDYEKLGVWPDGIYMSANLFSFGAGSAFQGARVWAFNKAQMYAGSPTVQTVTFDIGGGDFTVVPSNARLQTGTPPAGRPNLFIGSWLFTNALTVYKFHVDWNSISLSTLTGPDVPIAATSWPNASVANVPQSGTATLLDALQIRAMVQNQYTNIGGTESLWIPHTVRRGNTTGFAAPRWYQVNVTGGTVAANLPQAATWDPDAANVTHRWMPSLAVDRAGNMAMGYTTSSATTFPSIAYAGRLAADPVNTFSQTETVMFAGTASQTGTTRWGDYSSMMLDPDGCRFWYTAEYANPVSQTFDKRWKTKVGTFQFPSCTPVGAGGTLSGTVTETPGGAPIAGATVTLGSRSTTTNGSGVYSFSIPAGTYPTLSATAAGYGSTSASSLAVTDGGTTTQDFALTAAPLSSCLVDTSQANFLTGVSTNSDLGTTPGNVTLLDAPNRDQVNTAGTTTGTGFGTPNWTGQTFTAGVTGQLVKADIQLFCNGCGATPPNLTLSVRATSAGLPTGADLASVTVQGSTFATGSTVLYTATFASPITLTSGTQYALILRPDSAPAGSGYFWIRSSPSTYASGSRVLSADSGGTWSTDTTRDFNFKTYMQTGFASSGTLVSSLKDGNPPPNYGTKWTTLSWTATTPANTSIKFQAAGSNSQFGPFNFVGPDGTSGTFFTTSGASLTQFNLFRYLKYKAFLATTDSAATPALEDVTICYEGVPPTLSINGGNSQTATVGTSVSTAPSVSVIDAFSNPVSGVSVTFAVATGGGSVTGASQTTNASGIATVGSWTLGPSAGSGNNTLTATATGMTGSPVTFSASAISVPDAPTIGTATRGDGTVSVAFTAPASNGGSAITGYTATCTGTGGPFTNTGSTPAISVAVPNGTAVTCTVRATNGVGDSSESSPSNSVTPATLPGAPTIGTATRGDATVSVAFTAPASNGGSAITGYTATCTGTGGPFTSTGSTPAISVGVPNGTAVTCTVRATNGVGDSSESSPSNSVTPATLPGAPTIGTATGGNATVSVAFTASVSNGGSAITGYTATCTGAGGPFRNTGSAPAISVAVPNGTTVTCTVRATNGVGDSAESSPSNSVTTATAPGAPTIGTAIAGNTTVSVAFTGPASNGGTAITGYTATCGARSASGMTSPITVTGLPNGTPVTCSVVATNAVGNSAPSGASNSVTPQTVRISVNDVSMSEGNSGSATMTFTVSLSGVSSTAVSVSYATLDGTASAGSDYVATSGLLTFAPGETSKAIGVSILGDTTPESNEGFGVALSGSTLSTIARPFGQGTILNDDGSAEQSRAQSSWQQFFAVDARETPMVGDFDGDAKTDIVTFGRNNPSAVGDVYLSLSNGAGFGPSAKWHDNFAARPSEMVVVGDFNGDGRDDIATWLRSSTREVYVTLSTGSGLLPETVWGGNLGVTETDPLFAGDVNGDGKDDLILFARTQGRVYVALSDGTRFGAPSVWHTFFAVSTREKPRVADVNGDGKADIVTFASDSPAAFGDVYVALSDGSQFVGPTGTQLDSAKWSDMFAFRPDEDVRLGDVDGDGKADFVTFLPPPFAQAYVALSMGTYIADPVLWREAVTPLLGVGDSVFLGDVNGDGKSDLIIFAQKEGKVFVSLAQ